MRAFILHGSYGSPKENWIPWLKKKLEKLEWEVLTPKFPTPQNQSLDSWLKVFKKYERYLGPDTILVGHSLAPAFILTLLERSEQSVHSCFFVAGWTGKLNNPDFDTINATFAEKKFDWKKIKSKCKKFVVFCSDNDPYVPGEKTGELADALQADFVFVKGAGHFNDKAGYSEFPLLLEKIKALSSPISETVPAAPRTPS
jgi:uncharacterized protein